MSSPLLFGHRVIARRTGNPAVGVVVGYYSASYHCHAHPGNYDEAELPEPV